MYGRGHHPDSALLTTTPVVFHVHLERPRASNHLPMTDVEPLLKALGTRFYRVLVADQWYAPLPSIQCRSTHVQPPRSTTTIHPTPTPRLFCVSPGAADQVIRCVPVWWSRDHQPTCSAVSIFSLFAKRPLDSLACADRDGRGYGRRRDASPERTKKTDADLIGSFYFVCTTRR